MRRGLPAAIDPAKDPYSLYEGVEYAQFWSGMQKRNLDALEHALVRKLLPLSGRRLLDVGCGFGRLADCYLDRFQQVIMVDGAVSLLRQAVERTRGKAVYIAGDAMRLPFKKATFDTALMIRVFHHIQDSKACLSELSRILCGDGRFIFSYMNKQNALKVIRWLIGTNKERPFSVQPTGQGSTFISHHPRGVDAMLHAAGFSNIEHYGAGVLDRVAERTGFEDFWLKLGSYLAPVLGRSKIAPWLFCSTSTKTAPVIVDARQISDILQCPSCRGSVSARQDEYVCLQCRRKYPITDGIIDLRI